MPRKETQEAEGTPKTEPWQRRFVRMQGEPLLRRARDDSDKSNASRQRACAFSSFRKMSKSSRDLTLALASDAYLERPVLFSFLFFLNLVLLLYLFLLLFAVSALPVCAERRRQKNIKRAF